MNKLMERMDRMDNGYKIFSLRVARELQSRGFKLLGTEPNANNIRYKNFIFENTQQLILAVKEIKEAIKSKSN